MCLIFHQCCKHILRKCKKLSHFCSFALKIKCLLLAKVGKQVNNFTSELMCTKTQLIMNNFWTKFSKKGHCVMLHSHAQSNEYMQICFPKEQISQNTFLVEHEGSIISLNDFENNFCHNSSFQLFLLHCLTLVKSLGTSNHNSLGNAQWAYNARNYIKTLYNSIVTIRMFF